MFEDCDMPRGEERGGCNHHWRRQGGMVQGQRGGIMGLIEEAPLFTLANVGEAAALRSRGIRRAAMGVAFFICGSGASDAATARQRLGRT